MRLKRSVRVTTGAAAFAFAACAQAQSQVSSVTIYGLLDTGIEYLSHAGPGGAGSQYRISSGNVAGSRWGLRGKEELGGGLSGIFVLEGGISTDTGGMTLNNRLFGRQAFVGLESRWGRITLGRHINTLFDVMVPFDPLRYATYGVLAQDGQFAGRADNSVKYTGNFGNLTVVGLYSAGYDSTIANGSEAPGNVRIGQEIGAAASYTIGSLGIALSYDQRRGTTAATQANLERRYVAGLLWSAGPFTAMAGYRFLQGTLTLAPEVRASLYWVGASYKFQPAFTLAAGVYRNDQRHSPNGAVSYSLSGIYALSKRTELYVNASYMDNRGASTNSATFGVTVAPGVNQTGVVAGVKHVF